MSDPQQDMPVRKMDFAFGADIDLILDRKSVV